MRWPAIDLPCGDFVQHVQRLRDGGAPMDRYLADHAGDIFLAAACLAGHPAAQATFETMLRLEVSRAVARIDASEDFRAEVAQTLAERLLCPPLERLKHYSGSGPLGQWLNVAAARAAIDLKRRAGASLRRLASIPTALETTREPEWELLRARYREPLEAALRDAVATLEPRDRMVLRLYLLRGETIDSIGKMCGVHRATVARWIVAAQRSIVAVVVDRLGRELALSPEECNSLARDLKSQLEVSLDRLL
jgi:RNA polymerase sigma-70 factor (ECF subfamily)